MNRDLILEAAAKLFAENGYHAITMNELSSSIGATKGLIYNYFKSKDDILGNIHLLYLQHYLSYMSTFYKRKFGSADEQLRTIIKAHVTFDFRNRGMLRVVWETFDISYSPDIQSKVYEKRREYFRKLKAVVKEAMQAGVLPQVDPNTATNLIIWSLDMTAMLHSDARISCNELANIVADFFIRNGHFKADPSNTKVYAKRSKRLVKT